MITMKVREHRDDLVGRVRILTGLATAFLALIGGGFWFVQILHGSYYRELAENNRLRKLPIRAPRGLIYDRQGNVLAENVPSYNLYLDRSRSVDLAASLAFAAEIVGQPVEVLETQLARLREIPSFVPVLLAQHLTLSQAARFGVATLEHPEFEISVGHLRLYRHGRQTAHLLGYLGEVSREDLDRFGGTYSPGDLIGKSGIEQAYDLLLRGQDGEREVVVDSHGKVVEEYRRKAVRPGRDLVLTLDLRLQQEAERLLEDRVGAVVALDPRNGEILALVSSPAYDPNLFARSLRREEWQALREAPHHPFQNRALQNTYSPGSIFKVVVAMAGLAEGVTTPTERIWCAGSAHLYNHQFRCWQRGGHGWVNLHDAIKLSCDIYFYHLGQRLGIERIASYSRLFGLGRPTGIDLPGEKGGLVPDPEWSLRVRRSPWYAGETISVAIGQGPLLVTPLQVAALLAQLANGGHPVTPHLLKGLPLPPAKPLAVEVREEALKRVRRALWAVVNEEHGTGRGARIPGAEVAGKTGTVQVVAQRGWVNNESLPFEHRDHAWFASFAPMNDPRLVVVVFVEHGGKGSQAAAPVAKALYAAYFESDLGNHHPR